MAEKRFGIKPAIDTSTVGSPTTTGVARGPNDTGSPLNQDQATDTYQHTASPATSRKAGMSGKDSPDY